MPCRRNVSASQHMPWRGCLYGGGPAPRSRRTAGKQAIAELFSVGSNSVWLNGQGQQQALRDVFDQYLLHAFGMLARAQPQIPHVTADVSDRFARQYLRDVEDRARRICAELVYGDEALRHDPGLAQTLDAEHCDPFSKDDDNREAPRRTAVD